MSNQTRCFCNRVRCRAGRGANLRNAVFGLPATLGASNSGAGRLATVTTDRLPLSGRLSTTRPVGAGRRRFWAAIVVVVEREPGEMLACVRDSKRSWARVGWKGRMPHAETGPPLRLLSEGSGRRASLLQGRAQKEVGGAQSGCCPRPVGPRTKERFASPRDEPWLAMVGFSKSRRSRHPESCPSDRRPWFDHGRAMVDVARVTVPSFRPWMVLPNRGWNHGRRDRNHGCRRRRGGGGNPEMPWMRCGGWVCFGIRQPWLSDG